MSWDPEVEELRRRLELARAMGGPENVERQHKAGRLTVRERIERLLTVLALSERRGPAPVARALYEDLTPPMPRALRLPPAALRQPGSGRPTKRERRRIDRLRGW